MNNKRLKKTAVIIVNIILLPFVWWFLFGAGVPVAKDMLGVGRHNDGTHHLYMSEDQIKGSMTPEQYENWKNRLGK